MKKYLVTTAVALVIATPALANDSDIDQIGVNNDATVDQTLGEGGTSVILQQGDDDVASVMQTDGGGANNNNALIEQLDSNGVETATIIQNNASGSGVANVATILQDSVDGGNVASINQSGSDNEAKAQQGPGDAEFFGFPVSPLGITNSTASISQDGVGNDANTLQIVGSDGGDNNSATIGQVGDDNTANINQGSGTTILSAASNDNDNVADIFQSGDLNESTINQGGDFGFAESTQSGSGNISTISQTGGAFLALGNNATVDQAGHGNNSTVEQTTAFGEFENVPSATFANVIQDGDNNTSTVTQRALGGHSATVVQMNDDNTSTILQQGLLHTAEVTQSNGNQTSMVDQSGLLSFANAAFVDQSASQGNFSMVTQGGSFNVSNVNQ